MAKSKRSKGRLCLVLVNFLSFIKHILDKGPGGPEKTSRGRERKA